MTRETLFSEALKYAKATERAAFLAGACNGDKALQQDIESLVVAHLAGGDKLQSPVVSPENTIDYDSKAKTTASSANTDALPGQLIAGKYKLLEQIGEGGMGAVYYAEQIQPIRRKVALKLIKPGMDSKQVIARFDAERQALALMDHPNVAKVLDAGTLEGPSARPFFVMEYVKGIPITEYCDKARLNVLERLELFMPVCQAVQHAHQKGVIHRDLKPSNILVCLYDGKPVPKVIDFGLAKAMHQPLTEQTLFTAHGLVMGTPLYMSPEQAELNNLDIDTRTDIYSLGVLLYELLTGSTPLEKQRIKEAAFEEMLRLIKEEEPPRPSTRLTSSDALPSIAAQRRLEPIKLSRLVKGDLDWIVMKCLEKERGRRYETANAVLSDVQRYLQDEPVTAGPPSVVYRLRKFVRRNRGRVIAGGLLTAMLFIVVGLVLYGLWRDQQRLAEQRYEQSLLTQRHNDSIAALLDRIKEAIRADRLEEAATLLGETAKQIDDKTLPDLRTRYERLRRDELTVRTMNDIFEERWMISRSDTHLDDSRAKVRYPQLFRDYGLLIGQESPTDTVVKLRQSPIAEQLSSALMEWFFVDSHYAGLLTIVDIVDPVPARKELRAAVLAGDGALVAKLVRTLDGSKLSPAYAISLGSNEGIGFEERLRILKTTWSNHSDSFPIALLIASNLMQLSVSSEDVRQGLLTAESIGWSQTAVALRPKNPLAHFRLGVALGFFDNSAMQATTSFRRAVELAPKFANAYGHLAFSLLKEGRRDEALEIAHKAFDLDNTPSMVHFVICEISISKQDYISAASSYRKWKEVRQTRKEDSVYEEHLGSMYDQVMQAVMSIRYEELLEGLLKTYNCYTAYRLFITDEVAQYPSPYPHIKSPQDWAFRQTFTAASAAVLAGTGQGHDAPPQNERPAIRKNALDWLSACYDAWHRQVSILPTLGAGTVGVFSAPGINGSIGAAAVLHARLADDSTNPKHHAAAHETMNRWLAEPHLAAVREDKLLEQLPKEEQVQWRLFWSKVRTLRDQTAPKK